MGCARLRKTSDQSYERKHREQLDWGERPALLDHRERPRHQEGYGHCGCGPTARIRGTVLPFGKVGQRTRAAAAATPKPTIHDHPERIIHAGSKAFCDPNGPITSSSAESDGS